MAEPYLTDLKALLTRIDIPVDAEISSKHFFSGAAAYVGGQIFVSLSPVGLAIKLPQDQCEMLIMAGAKPLKYFPKSPVKKGYAVLPEQLANDERALKDWVMSSISYVLNG